MQRLLIAAALVAAGSAASAQTAAEDEARIEELIRREQAVRQVAADRAVGSPGEAAGALVTADAAVVAPAGTPAAASAAPEPAAATIASRDTDTVMLSAEEAKAFAPDAPIADEDALGGDDWKPHDPKEIAIADLGAHVGKAVRVRSMGGRVRVGRIESVDDRGVTLKSPMGGGYAKYTLPYSQITKIERL